MTGTPVSIVVLNYNYERFVSAAIDSALAQTHADVEVVVVDDGSTDASREVIAGYGNRIVPVMKPNGGQGSAMNAGFETAGGEIVMFLDADDLLHREAAKQVAAAFGREPDTAWVMFRLAMIDATGTPTGRIRPRRSGVMPDGDLRSHLGTYRCFHWQPTSGNAFATRALERVMPVPADDYRISADAYLAGVVPLCGRVRSVDEVLGSYRLHGDSNYTSVAVDARYFRDQIERQVVTHRHALDVADDVGVEIPEDPRAPKDAAFLGFRLSSLVLEPDAHPFADESRLSLARAGIRAALANGRLTWLTRLRRAAWFLGAGLLPRGLAEKVVARSPDTPAARARSAAGPHRDTWDNAGSEWWGV